MVAGKPLPVASSDGTWRVPPELGGQPGDRVLRGLAGGSWATVRGWFATGKVRVDGATRLAHERTLPAGAEVILCQHAPKPRTAELQAVERDLIVHVDASVVVVRKPAGLSTVPFDDGSGEQEATLDALVREALGRRDRIRGRAPLGVVQRLDRATSGLLVFARTFEAKKHLGQQLRVHSMHRRYLAIAHGVARATTHRTTLVANRGDGLRGTARRRMEGGQLAVTHVTVVEALRGATLIACQLETGRTHQIRIHLAESGHPLVGEAVYIRDFRGERIPAPRLMLHAAELGFVHPSTEQELRFEDPVPADFEAVLKSLRAP